MKQDIELQEGDIAFGLFPYAEGETQKPHYVLILERKPLGNVLVAYSSSKHINESCRLRGELILTKEEAARLGMPNACRFDFNRRATMSAFTSNPGWVSKDNGKVVFGNIMNEVKSNPTFAARAKKALKEAGLL